MHLACKWFPDKEAVLTSLHFYKFCWVGWSRDFCYEKTCLHSQGIINLFLHSALRHLSGLTSRLWVVIFEVNYIHNKRSNLGVKKNNKVPLKYIAKKLVYFTLWGRLLKEKKNCDTVPSILSQPSYLKIVCVLR